MKFEVGQKLWLVRGSWVPDRNQHPNAIRGREVTIIKVGRKWLTIDNYDRVNVKTLQIDSCSYNARCHLSKEDYLTHQAVSQEWEWLKRMIPYSVPTHMTLDSIQLIASVLQLEPRKKTA